MLHTFGYFSTSIAERTIEVALVNIVLRVHIVKVNNGVLGMSHLY